MYGYATDRKLSAGIFCAGRPAGGWDRDLFTADAFVICVQRDEEPPVERMLCDTGEERAGMLTRFLYENAVEPDQMPAILRDICGWAVG
mgnify:CR=1 FL=1